MALQDSTLDGRQSISVTSRAHGTSTPSNDAVQGLGHRGQGRVPDDHEPPVTSIKDSDTQATPESCGACAADGGASLLDHRKALDQPAHRQPPMRTNLPSTTTSSLASHRGPSLPARPVNLVRFAVGANAALIVSLDGVRSGRAHQPVGSDRRPVERGSRP